MNWYDEAMLSGVHALDDMAVEAMNQGETELAWSFVRMGDRLLDVACRPTA